MPKIQNYIIQDDGTTTVVIEGVELGNKETLLLDNGIDVEVDVLVNDPYKITDKQRRKVFALVNDIEIHTGTPREWSREMFQEYLTFLNGYSKRISLSDCTQRQAGELIELIIEWIFENDIPLRYKTSNLVKNDRTFLYMATVKRKCVICGKPNSELAHYQAVGRGRDRRKIEHTDNRVLALCREHHQTQHDMGMDSFNVKYHLQDSWVAVDEKLNRMLKGLKN
ncbi:putative HNHc nuclease [Staphylococcus equorum]|uniref:putative HNHc nuclease n=1 Tax=Staphylococcus equorum TaxID=246432 RepID=UPI003CED576F